MNNKLAIGVAIFNQLEYTKETIMSILNYTSIPFKLILVDDNSSEAGMREYLDSLVERFEFITLLRNEEQKGLPYNLNEIIDHSKEYEYVVFSNSDVFVTPGWAEEMITSMERYKGIGVLGPITSHCYREDQKLPVAERNKIIWQEPEILKFGQWCRDMFQGQIMVLGQNNQLENISGFFFMVRRDVIDKIGYFDERFGLGSFEEDDFNRRAQLTKYDVKDFYKLAINRNTYVHHRGHSTFRSAKGVNSNQLWQKNQQIFSMKWRVPEDVKLYQDRLKNSGLEIKTL